MDAHQRGEVSKHGMIYVSRTCQSVECLALVKFTEKTWALDANPSGINSSSGHKPLVAFASLMVSARQRQMPLDRWGCQTFYNYFAAYFNVRLSHLEHREGVFKMSNKEFVIWGLFLLYT